MRLSLPTVAVLDQIAVAAPCPVSWDAMHGDHQVRFCARCERNVYNLSEMSAVEAVQLIEARQGQLCVQLFRRRDGTLVTADCPVGWRWRVFKFLRRRRLAWAAALFALVFLSGCPMGGGNMRPMPVQPIMTKDPGTDKDAGGNASPSVPK
jgi:hypothetical protein